MKNFGRAREVVEQLLMRVAEERVGPVPGMEEVRTTLLEDAIRFYEQLLAERNTDPEIRMAVAAAQLRLSWLYSRHQYESKREPAIRRGVELLESLAAEYPEEPKYRAALADGLSLLGHLNAWNTDRWKESAAALQRSVDLFEELVRNDPDPTKHAGRLGGVLNLLAVALTRGGQHDQAEAAWRRGLAHLDRARQANRSVLDGDYMGTLMNLGRALAQKNPGAAEALFGRAQARREAIEKSSGGLPVDSVGMVINFDTDLGRFYQTLGRRAEAEAAHRRSMETGEKYVAGHRSLRINRYHLARAFYVFGQFLLAEDRPGEAEAAFRRGSELCEVLLLEAPAAPGADWWSKYCLNRSGLAHALAVQGHDAEAAAIESDACEFVDRLLAQHPNSIKRSSELNTVAWLLISSRHSVPQAAQTAAELATQAVRLAPQRGAFWNTLGIAHYRTGDWKAALAALEKSSALPDGNDSFNWFFRAMAHRKLNNVAEAHQWFDRAVVWMEKNRPKDFELRRFRAEAAAVLAEKQPK